ncbi:MAG: hypothetical protein KatS3mg087_1200 [Patescibacteria group bacterium]|nr:MAG: hypothetical protein KatS3mg087_1200 [Patescibacteria group bacterium]
MDPLITISNESHEADSVDIVFGEFGNVYVKAPITMLVEGVHVGSAGALYYPIAELTNSVNRWNFIPITLGHPDGDGVVNDSFLSKNQIGFVANTRIEGQKLVADGYFDVDLMAKLDESLLLKLLEGQKLRVSTGLRADLNPSEGEHNNEKYSFIATNYRPDHLALLLSEKAACDINDGCGVNNCNGICLCSKCASRTKNQKLTPGKACKILKDGSISGKALTEAQRKFFGMLCSRASSSKPSKKAVSNRSSSMTEQEKQQLVDRLVSNAGLDSPSPWTEDDREALMLLPDEKLKALVEQLDYVVELKAERDKALANASKKDKKDDAKNDKPSEPVSNDEPQPRQLTFEDWIQSAPDEVRAAVQNALALERARKAELVKVITNNKHNRFTREQLMAKPIDELEALAALAAPGQPRKQAVVNYSAFSPGISFVDNIDPNEDLDMAPEPFLFLGKEGD